MRRVFVVLLLGVVVLGGGVIALLNIAERSFGPPAPSLSPRQRIQYAARLLWADGLLTQPLHPGAPEIEFSVEPGETVASVTIRLQEAGIVSSAAMLKDYLTYTGMDMTLQAGRYKIGAGMSSVELAQRMQDSTPSEVEFVILPGWRLEEVAASMPTSGLLITPQEFLAEASQPRPGYDFLAGAQTVEGFLYPDSYTLARTAGPQELIGASLRRAAAALTPALREGYAAQGLRVYEAVTLASIVERESVRAVEAPLIASVYLNRLREGMRLDADPTVQYALGYDALRGTWWTNPLSLDELKFASPYNTYQTAGLPPTPICNPGDEALQAVAAPSTTTSLFFSSRCDGSGFHNFAETFEEHLANLCPGQ